MMTNETCSRLKIKTDMLFEKYYHLYATLYNILFFSVMFIYIIISKQTKHFKPLLNVGTDGQQTSVLFAFPTSDRTKAKVTVL